jgi:hypothetical protein
MNEELVLLPYATEIIILSQSGICPGVTVVFKCTVMAVIIISLFAAS